MNNYNFSQSLDGLNNIDADNINSANATFSNANITSLSNCNLINCNTSTTPVNNNAIVNKSFVDNNFINFTSDQTITGTKRFNTIFTGDHSYRDVVSPFTNRLQSYLAGTSFVFTPIFNSNSYRFYTKDSASTETFPLTINSASTTITNNLTTNNLTADNTTGTQNIFTNNTSGTVNIGTGQTSGGNINIGGSSSPASNVNIKSDLKIFKGILMYDVSSPFQNFCQLYPAGSGMNYIMNAGATTASHHNFFAYNNTNLSNKSLAISYTNINVLDGVILSCRQIYSTAPTSASHELFSNMTTGTLTMGSLTSNIINNSINTFNAQATFTSDVTVPNINVNNAVNVLNSGNLFRMSLSGTNMIFNPTFYSSTVQFKATNSVGGISAPITMTYGQTQIGNLLQTDYGLSSNGEASFNTWVNLKFRTRIYDLVSPFTNYTQMYMINGNEFIIGPNANGDFISFYCKDAILGQLQTFKSSALGNTSLVPFIASSTATFNGQATFNTNAPLCSVLASSNSELTNKLYVDNAISGASILGSNNNWSGTNLFNNVVTFANNLIFSASTINLNSSGTTHNTNFFTSITSGTHSYLSNLSNNSVFNMFSSATSDVNLDINARVKFRQVKLYNQVKAFGGGTLTFPLEENILIRPLGATATITLPLINSINQLGLTFNFIKNSTTALITFTAQGTNTIVRNGSITGTTSDILLGEGHTSTQLTILELVASSGVYNWVEVNSSLPQQISNPVGQIIQMAMGTVPSGYLQCNGGSYSSSTYPELSAFLNFTYGGSSGSGLFQVPDFRGMFLRGNGTNGIDSTYVSSTYGSLQTDGIRSHTHGIDFGFLATVSGGGGQNAYNSTSPNYNNPGTGSGRATGITTSNNNPYADTRPGNFAVLYCIKY